MWRGQYKAPFKFTVCVRWFYFIVQLHSIFECVCMRVWVCSRWANTTWLFHEDLTERERELNSRQLIYNFSFECSTFILILFRWLQFYYCLLSDTYSRGDARCVAHKMQNCNYNSTIIALNCVCETLNTYSKCYHEQNKVITSLYLNFCSMCTK